MSTVTQTAAGWTRMVEDVSFSRGPRRQFWRFFWWSLPAAFLFGFIFSEGPVGRRFGDGWLFVLAWLLVCPGALGVGWWFVHRIWMGIAVPASAAKALRAAEHEVRKQVERFGAVRYLDVSVQLEAVTGLAIAGSTLLVFQDNHMRKLLRKEIAGWRWEIETPQLIQRSGHRADVFDNAQFNDEQRSRVAATNGFYIQTNDPEKPELLFRTASEEVCKRWEVVMRNIDEGRIVID
jgi:hypothetical protein